ncbi:MAG: uL30 family ribosomal protein [archaeon]
MILVIRISGMVEIPKNVQLTLDRMRLRRKYSAILLRESAETMTLLQSVRNFVAFGDVTDETLTMLIEKRAESSDGKKIDAKAVVAGLKNKDLADLGIKPFIRLHSPRGGINSKLHFPLKDGVLGDNKAKINDLVRRML